MAKYMGIEKYIYSDAYVFFLKYKDIPNEDYYWEKCIEDAKLLIFKYKEHPFARQMITATIDQLDHTINKTLLNGYTHEQWEQLLSLAKNTPFK